MDTATRGKSDIPLLSRNIDHICNRVINLVEARRTALKQQLGNTPPSLNISRSNNQSLSLIAVGTRWVMDASRHGSVYIYYLILCIIYPIHRVFRHDQCPGLRVDREGAAGVTCGV